MVYKASIVYESQQSMGTAQSSRASSSIAAYGEKEEDAADEALAYILNWLDPERLSEDVLIKPLLERSWTNVKEPFLLCSWRRCFGALADVGNPELKQKAAMSMAMELARFVSYDLGLESQELRDLSVWVLAEQKGDTRAGTVLSLR